ncbi:MAG: T9SS type A sorting domain-containing protein [Bacteroidales bacterium]|nr:T9SS type A sorting domain-containing protein [Bacteroidales bacterium]
MKKLVLFILSIGFVLFYFSIALAQPGMLDDTFDGDGKVTTSFGNYDDQGYAVAIQEDGKIVVAGSTYNVSNSFDFALVRYNTDGSLDNTFDQDGKVTTDFGNSSEGVYALEIQPDGKILAAGVSCNLNTLNGAFALSRYNSDGSLDDSFGTGGLVTTIFNNNDDDIANAMALQDDGKILLAGQAYNGNYNNFAIARYNQDGSLDSSFGTNGKILTTFSTKGAIAYGIAVQTDGKIVAAGISSDENSNIDFSLVRYNTDGSFDNSFGVGGKVTTDFEGLYDEARSVVIQTDGKIILGGWVELSTGLDFALARYTTDGGLDNSFDYDGKVTSNFINEYVDQGYSVALQEDGKILLVGLTQDINGTNFGMFRYNNDGSQDLSFGFLGAVITDFGGSFEQCNSVAIQPDNRIVLAGFSDIGGSGYVIAVARYLSGLETGILNFSETQSHLLIYPNPIYSNATLKYILQKEEIITIDLYDIKGSIVQSFISNQHKQEGNNEEVLNFSNSIPAGYYNLVISNEEGQQSIRIVKL